MDLEGAFLAKTLYLPAFSEGFLWRSLRMILEAGYLMEGSVLAFSGFDFITQEADAREFWCTMKTDLVEMYLYLTHCLYMEAIDKAPTKSPFRWKQKHMKWYP